MGKSYSLITLVVSRQTKIKKKIVEIVQIIYSLFVQKFGLEIFQLSSFHELGVKLSHNTSN